MTEPIHPHESPESRTHEHSARNLLRQGPRFLVLDNLSKVLEPVLVLVCAKLYSGGDWGFFKYYESILLLLLRLAVAGLDRGVVWIHSRRRDDESFARSFSQAVNFSVLFAVLLVLMGGAQWLGWIPALGRPGGKTAGGLSIACYLASIPLQAATQLFLQALINKRALGSLLLARNLLVPIFSLGPAMVMAFTPFKAQGLAFSYLAGGVAGFLISAFLFFRTYPGAGKYWVWSARVPRDLIRFSLPLASTDFFMSFAYRIDILLLGRFAGLQAVEVYAVIVMIANTLRSIRQSFDGILLSVFSQGAKDGVTPAVLRNFNHAAWMVLTLQLPFVPLSLLFGGDLLGLLAPTYAAGGRVLSIALICNMGITLGAFAGQLTAGLGRTYLSPLSHGLFFASNVGLNFLLIPKWGAEGAALATGMSTMLGGFLHFAAVTRMAGTFPLLGEFVYPFLAGSVLFAPALASGLWLKAPHGQTAALLAVSFGLFAWFSRRYWKKFHAHTA